MPWRSALEEGSDSKLYLSLFRKKELHLSLETFLVFKKQNAMKRFFIGIVSIVLFPFVPILIGMKSEYGKYPCTPEYFWSVYRGRKFNKLVRVLYWITLQFIWGYPLFLLGRLCLALKKLYDLI